MRARDFLLITFALIPVSAHASYLRVCGVGDGPDHANVTKVPNQLDANSGVSFCQTKARAESKKYAVGCLSTTDQLFMFTRFVNQNQPVGVSSSEIDIGSGGTRTASELAGCASEWGVQ